MIIDFGKIAISISPTVINGRDIELVDEYRYLGTMIDNKLNFDAILRLSEKSPTTFVFLKKNELF